MGRKLSAACTIAPHPIYSRYFSMIRVYHAETAMARQICLDMRGNKNHPFLHPPDPPSSQSQRAIVAECKAMDLKSVTLSISKKIVI